MDIKRTKILTIVEYLYVNEAFEFNDCVYLKVEIDEFDPKFQIPAVDLRSGKLVYFNEKTYVFRKNATLLIKE